MNILLFLAQSAFPIPTLIHLVIVLIVLGIIFGLVWWGLGYCPLPMPFMGIVRFLVVLIFVLILITLLWPLLSIR